MNGKFYIAMGIAFVIDIIIYSIFPYFNTATPSIGGLTLFYSYQIILLLVSTILFAAVVLVVRENGSKR
jgi:Protein of unknown function (DUF3311).